MMNRSLVAVLLLLAMFASLVAAVDLAAQPRPASRTPRDVRLEVPATATLPGPPVMIVYALRSPAQKVRIEVVDSSATVIRMFEGPAGEGTPSGNAGQNRFPWDLRHASPTLLDPQPQDARGLGPWVLPGKYEIRVTADGKAVTQAVMVNRSSEQASLPDEVLKARFDVAIEVRDRTSEVNQAILDVRAMKAQVADRAKNAKSPPVGLAADVVNRKLGEVEQLLVPLSARLADLRRAIDATTRGPEEGTAQSLREVSEGATAARERLRGVLRNEVGAFNRMLGNAQMAPIDVPERLREPATPPKGP